MFEVVTVYVICLLVMLLSSSTSLQIWQVLISLWCVEYAFSFTSCIFWFFTWWVYSGGTSTSSSKPTSGNQRSSQQNTSYQIPASALYESADNPRASGSSIQTSPLGMSGNCDFNVYSFYCFPCCCLFDLYFFVNLIKFKVCSMEVMILFHCISFLSWKCLKISELHINYYLLLLFSRTWCATYSCCYFLCLFLLQKSPVVHQMLILWH